MFFKSANEVIPCGMFSIEHFILLAITTISVAIALKFTKNIEKDKVKKIIRKTTIFLWILEIIKIIFNIKNYGFNEVNKYVPLYFCSLILYAGIFSGYCKGTLKKMGDVFLSTGGIIAGLIFLIYPLTSLTSYPMLHYISLHSFVLHGIMVYIGLLMLITRYTTIEKRDIIYYSTIIVIISAIAYVVNLKYGSNLMFISENYPGTYIDIIYNNTGRFFTLFMTIAQSTMPFYTVYGIYNLFKTKNKKEIVEVINEKTEKKEKIIV